MMTLTACHLGAISYRDGLRLQDSLVRARAAGETGDWLLFPDHPPVVTIGRSGSTSSIVDPSRLSRLGVEVFEVTRGGDATWHGPGQLVGYLISDLSTRERDLHRFLRGLEQVLENVLQGFGIEARSVPGRTGVWVGEEKIASIGIAVRQWVSYHGFALNVVPDLKFFDLIHPCGLRGIQMTSMGRLLGEGCPRLSEVRETAARELAQQFGYGDLNWVPTAAPWRFLGEAGPTGPAPAPAEGIQAA